jgi:hypothetical protein
MIELVAEVLRLRGELQREAASEGAAAIAPGMLEAIVAAALLRPPALPALRAHYCRTMPALLAAQLRPSDGVFRARLDLRRMPRLREALERLFSLVASAGLSCAGTLGAADPEGLAQGRTLGEVYRGCHFGRSMPMLYASPADLAEASGDPLAFVDARLVGPLVHELSHLRAADPPAPANLHEGLAAFIGSEAWPAQVWPEDRGGTDGEADAIPGCAFFAALGGFVVRAVGLPDALRMQAGQLDVRDALGARCAEALRVYGFLPFLETGAPHLLADAFHPQRWWKLVDLRRDPALERELSARFVEPALAGAPPRLSEWDAWLDGLSWRDLPSWRDEPRRIDDDLALRAERALLVRAERRGLTFRARRVAADAQRGPVPTRLSLDREQCLLRSDLPGPDAIGAPPEHPYPPPLCRQ